MDFKVALHKNSYFCTIMRSNSAALDALFAVIFPKNAILGIHTTKTYFENETV